MIKRITGKIQKLFTEYNRNLLMELISAEFKAYEQNSILGVCWNLLNPAITLLIMYCVFERKYGQHVKFYPLFLLIGVVTVNFFITVTTRMIVSIAINWNIVLNSTIPRENFVLADLYIYTCKFLIELSLCCLLSIFYGVFAWPSLLLILPLLAAYTGLVLGFGLIVSLLYCVAMDIDHIWRIASRLFLFITPVFYSLEHTTPIFAKLIYWFNPITPFLIAFRQVFIWDNTFNIANYLYSLFLGCSFLIFGYFIFVIFENTAIERV